MATLSIIYALLALICVYGIYKIFKEYLNNNFGFLLTIGICLVIFAAIASFLGYGFPNAFTNSITVFSTIIAISELALFTDMPKEKSVKLGKCILLIGLFLFFGGILVFKQVRTSLSNNDFSSLSVLGFAIFLIITAKKENEMKSGKD